MGEIPKLRTAPGAGVPSIEERLVWVGKGSANRSFILDMVDVGNDEGRDKGKLPSTF